MVLYNDNIEINDILNDFLKLFISCICSRCDRSILDDPYYVHVSGDFPIDKCHHNGEINSYLRAEKSIKNQINNFINDIEHGLFHGLMTAFISFFINDSSLIKQKAELKDFVRIFSSCLLHDFIKDKHEHDEKLKEYFPGLLSETYKHRNPTSALEGTHLVLSDRTELRRYDDYISWVDDRLRVPIDSNSSDLLDIFYHKIRPALEYFYINRNSIWIRHGLERQPGRFRENDFFPYDQGYVSLKDLDDLSDTNGYPIEHDIFPFQNEHYACSNHDRPYIYGQIKAFISVDDFIKGNGIILDSGKRDHLYANSKIRLKDWVFTYDTLQEKNKVPFVFLLGINNVRVVSQENVALFGALIKLLTVRFTLLNMH